MAMNYDPYNDRYRIEEEMRYREKQAYERAKHEALSQLSYQNQGLTISSAALGLGQLTGALGAVAAAPAAKQPNPVILLLEDL